MQPVRVIYFDGVCHLCQGSVKFIIARDPSAKFKFAARTGGDSIVLSEDGREYQRSTAALRIARQLSGAWPLLYVFIAVPRFIRDAAYDVIAKNRYRWFGKDDSCMMPTPELRARFIVDDPTSPTTAAAAR